RDSWGSLPARVLRPQLAVFLLLTPALVFFTGQFSPWAPLVNVIAIPLVGMLIVPLCLVGTALLFLLPATGQWLLGVAEALLDACFAMLAWVAAQGGVVTVPGHVGLWAALSAAVAALLWLLPMPARQRLLTIPLCLPLLFPRLEPAPEHGEFHSHILDVGQGLAVVVQTANHVLLYDSGARYHQEFDLGEAVVVPVLKRLGRPVLDGVVISHWDNDHSGGLESVLAAFAVARRYGPDRIGPLWQQCSPQSWRWDGVLFAFMRSPAQATAGNNSSCVLRISGAHYSLLLPGDIERAVERDLVLQYGEGLHSEVLVVPHHGSATSSSWPFIKTVNPQLVIYSAGFGNAFGHPAELVQDRYAVLGTVPVNTGASGMVSIESGEGGLKISSYRDRHPRYWR
ncbi:MAG: ComEC/Rec2 family competence protein, partial [Gammaproteobacteria bacterium]